MPAALPAAVMRYHAMRFRQIVLDQSVGGGGADRHPMPAASPSVRRTAWASCWPSSVDTRQPAASCASVVTADVQFCTARLRRRYRSNGKVEAGHRVIDAMQGAEVHQFAATARAVDNPARTGPFRERIIPLRAFHFSRSA